MYGKYHPPAVIPTAPELARKRSESLFCVYCPISFTMFVVCLLSRLRVPSGGVLTRQNKAAQRLVFLPLLILQATIYE